MQYPPSLKEKAKKIFAYFDKNKDIPELVYRFSDKTCVIQVWPYLNMYYLEEDGSRTYQGEIPGINWERMTFHEFQYWDKDFLVWDKTRLRFIFTRYWRKKRWHIISQIRKWLAYIPKELSDVLREYYDDSGYIMKALYYASRSAYYYQLCINNSGLAYLLLRKEDWNPAHPLYEKNPLDVVGEKQEVLCELLGYSRSHAKILRKIPPHYWEREYLIRSPKEFRKILNHPRVVKLIHGIKSLSYGSISIIRSAYEYGWLDRLEVSLLDQILLLENNGNFCSQVLNRGTLERFTYQNPGRDKRNISIEDIVTVWRECMEFNRNWRIKTINSLYYHENLMIQQLSRISENGEILNPTSFPKPPIPYQEWNQADLFGNNSSMTIIPIRNGYELLVAGKKMKNCAYSYKLNILNGDYFCYLLKFESGETYMVAFDKYTVSESDMEMNYEGYLDWDWDEIFIPANEDEAMLASEYSLSYKEMWEPLNSDDSPSKDTIIGYLWKLSEIKGVGNREAPRFVVDELRKWLEF